MSRRTSVVVATLLAALVVFLLLLPWSGNDSDPPECFSVFGYVVPCGFGPDQQQGVGFALGGSVIGAGLVVLGAWSGRVDRRSSGR